jgi:hypothetical protein
VAASVPTSLLPCWVQTPLLRVKTQAAPVYEPSADPPTMAVLPSPDNAMDAPWLAPPTAAVPTSLLPCWVQMERGGTRPIDELIRKSKRSAQSDEGPHPAEGGRMGQSERAGAVLVDFEADRLDLFIPVQVRIDDVGVSRHHGAHLFGDAANLQVIGTDRRGIARGIRPAGRTVKRSTLPPRQFAG